MKVPRALGSGAIAALAVFMVMAAPDARLQTFDPYGWAGPGVESLTSRDLYPERRRLYMTTAMISFAVAWVMAFAASVLRRRRKLS